MTKYLAGVLTMIAVGVLLVAYGLLNPRTPLDAAAMLPAPGGAALAQPVSMQVPGYGAAPASPAMYAPTGQMLVYTPAAGGYAQVPAVYAPAATAPRPVRTVTYAPASERRPVTRRVDSGPRRDWKRTAMIIGGTSAAAAGVGAIVGGKKGALIGAAIGGGASTIYQVTR